MNFQKYWIFPGSALKLGLNYNVNDKLNVFFAGGQMSKATIYQMHTYHIVMSQILELRMKTSHPWMSV